MTEKIRAHAQPVWTATLGRFAFARARWLRRTCAAIVIILIVFCLIGFLGVPLLAHYVVLGRIAKRLDRPVAVKTIRFNPFSLRLDLRGVNIGERTASRGRFLDVNHVLLKLSWKSLFRMAPIVRELAIYGPNCEVVRVGAHRFNFSDLLEHQAAPASASSAPRRFAISDIQVNDGQVRIDDELLKQHHLIKHLELHVPFIADLPADVNVSVRPLLQMLVDGSPVIITGSAKPFAVPPESVIDLDLHQFEIPRYLAYVPIKLPIRIPQGTMSSRLQVDFLSAPDGPQVRVSGGLTIDRLDVRDSADAALASFNRLSIALDDVEPLRDIMHLGGIHLNGVSVHVVRNPDGTMNLASLMASNATTAGTPAAGHRAQVSLRSLELTNGTVSLIDKSVTPAAGLALGKVQGELKDLQTVGQQTPAVFKLGTTLGGGGSIALNGSLDLAHSQVTTDVTMEGVDLPALQGFARKMLAATVASGKLTAHARLRTLYSPGHFDVRAAPATIAVNDFEVRAPQQSQPPLGWKTLNVSVGQIDLAAHQAAITSVSSEGLHMFVWRQGNGQLNLASFLRATASAQAAPTVVITKTPASNSGAKSSSGRATMELQTGGQAIILTRSPPAPAPAHTSAWQYQIASMELAHDAIRVEDDTVPRHLTMDIAPLNLNLRSMSSDLSRPISLELEGTVNRKGSFNVAGTATPASLEADLRVRTNRLDLAQFDPYIASRLNARITRAALNTNGALQVSRRDSKMIVDFRGDAMLGGVRMLDKITNDSFMRWRSLTARHIHARIGEGQPLVHVAALALADFYARMILNRNGRLNLDDIISNPEEARRSLTRPHGAAGQAAHGLLPSHRAAVGHGPAPIPADLDIGEVAFKNGEVDYNDYFIKPNYSADLTAILGDVGSFGTRTSKPADVRLQGIINGNAPLAISGSINPLTPLAYVDLKAKANGVNLTNLSTFSAKYTGYPIKGGTLAVDVHYLLERQKLTARNHIVLDQLTFGNKVPSPSTLNLPIRLAVAILKNPQGRIDLHLPVSGSLSDPHFSLGGVLLNTFVGLIAKAAASPFNLIARAIGAGTGQNLNFVMFKPGWADLTPEAKSKLDTVAKALAARPALHLDITGRIDPGVDREALPAADVARSIDAQKVLSSGENPAQVDLAEVRITPDEYNKYLRLAYKAAKFKKPTDLLGLNKSLPPDQMKNLMLENAPVSGNDLKQLAQERAETVRKYLSTKVAPARLHITAPKLNTEGIKKGEQATRADLSLQ